MEDAVLGRKPRRVIRDIYFRESGNFSARAAKFIRAIRVTDIIHVGEGRLKLVARMPALLEARKVSLCSPGPAENFPQFSRRVMGKLPERDNSMNPEHLLQIMTLLLKAASTSIGTAPASAKSNLRRITRTHTTDIEPKYANLEDD